MLRHTWTRNLAWELICVQKTFLDKPEEILLLKMQKSTWKPPFQFSSVASFFSRQIKTCQYKLQRLITFIFTKNLPPVFIALKCFQYIIPWSWRRSLWGVIRYDSKPKAISPSETQVFVTSNRNLALSHNSLWSVKTELFNDLGLEKLPSRFRREECQDYKFSHLECCTWHCFS